MSDRGQADGEEDLKSEMVIESEALLHRLFHSWRSVYHYTITFNSIGSYNVFFDTEWSRAPSPHCPIPDIRVLIHFVVAYPRPNQDPSAAPAPNLPVQGPNLGIGEPRVTWRIQHEDLVHADLTEGIDHHVQRVLKHKAVFFAHHSVTPEHQAALDSRLVYTAPADEQKPLGLAYEGSSTVAEEEERQSAVGRVNAIFATLQQQPSSSASSGQASPSKKGSASSSASSSSSGDGQPQQVSLSALEQALRRLLKTQTTDPLGRVRFSAVTAVYAQAMAELGAADTVLTAADFAQIRLSVAGDAAPIAAAPASTSASSKGPDSNAAAAAASSSSPAAGAGAGATDVLVPVGPAVTATVELLQTLYATGEAERLCAVQELIATQRAAYRVRSAPAIHTVMDVPLLALDPADTGKISSESFLRFLGTLPLGLVDSELRAVLKLAPQDGSGNVLIHVLQGRYEQVLQDALREQAIEAVRNDVGVYLLGLLRARVASQGAVVVVDHVPCETLPVDAVGYVLLHDSTRVRLTPIQLYGLMRGAGLLPGGTGNSIAGGGGSSGGTGGQAVDIARFSRLASLVVYKLYEQVIARSGIVNPLNAAAAAAAGVAASASAGILSTASLAGLLAGGSTHASRGAAAPRAGVAAASGAGAGGAKAAVAAAPLGGFEELMRAKFVEFDSDDDGKLDQDEFARCLADTAMRLSQPQIHTLWVAADANKDGFVDWAEFLAFANGTLARLAAAQNPASSGADEHASAAASATAGPAAGATSGAVAVPVGGQARSRGAFS